MKTLYEVFDEFETCQNKKERMDVIGQNHLITTKYQLICYLVSHMIV